MSSNLVMWILAWMLIIFVIRFRLTTRPLRGNEKNSHTINSESLKFLQQYWSSQLPMCARKVADVESYLNEFLPKNLKHPEVVLKFLYLSHDHLADLQKVAAENPGQSEYILSSIYKGIFTEQNKDEVKARHWLRKSAEHGYAAAMFELGQQEIVETMREENSDTWQIARAYFTQASEKELPEGNFMFANILMANTEDHFSREEILEQMTRAAKLSHPVANFVMALAHLIDDTELLNKNKSREYFEKLNDLAYPSGQTYFAELILGSEMFEKDHLLAYQLLQDASKGGFISSGIPLGRMYEMGDVPPPELEKYPGIEALKKSLTLYRKAAIQGNCQAFLHMIRLHQSGVPAPDYDVELNYWFRFESAETNKSHLAVHFYLAWVYVNQYQSHTESLTVIEALLENLHIPFEEFNFDNAYQSILKSSIADEYSGFLQWLISDFCEQVYQREHHDLLEKAALNGLRIAQLVSIDPESVLALAFDVPDSTAVLQSQAELGCGVACLKMFECVLASDDSTHAVKWLEASADAMNTDALLRIARLKLQRYDYSEFDEKLRGVVKPDSLQAIKYLELAAMASQQAAYLLKTLYLSEMNGGPDIIKAKFYHRYAIINFGEEEQYVQSFIKSLVRVDSLQVNSENKNIEQ